MELILLSSILSACVTIVAGPDSFLDIRDKRKILAILKIWCAKREGGGAGEEDGKKEIVAREIWNRTSRDGIKESASINKKAGSVKSPCGLTGSFTLPVFLCFMCLSAEFCV